MTEHGISWLNRPGKERWDKGMYWDEPLGLVGSCTRCSDGCRSCWALAMEKRFHKGVEGKITLHPEALKKLNRKKPTVFAVWNDLFHEAVPSVVIDGVVCDIARASQHTVLVLTKRAERMRAWANGETEFQPPIPEIKNLWLGVTVESAKHLDRIEHLRQTPAAVRFISFEPLLGPMPKLDLAGIHWVIIGAESGPGKRPCRMEWIQGIIEQAKAPFIPIPVFVKQVHHLVLDLYVGEPGHAVMAPAGIELSKAPYNWPSYLRVREWPR
jgi:protein gp37